MGVFHYGRWRNGSGFFPAQMSNWRVFYWDTFSFRTRAPKWSHAKLYCRKLSSLNMDDSSQVQDCSLKDILMDVKIQGDDNTKLRQELSNLRQEVHGASLSVSSQVTKLKTDSQYTWKNEGNEVQYLLNSGFVEDLVQAVWAFDNIKGRTRPRNNF